MAQEGNTPQKADPAKPAASAPNLFDTLSSWGKKAVATVDETAGAAKTAADNAGKKVGEKVTAGVNDATTTVTGKPAASEQPKKYTAGEVASGIFSWGKDKAKALTEPTQAPAAGTTEQQPAQAAPAPEGTEASAPAGTAPNITAADVQAGAKKAWNGFTGLLSGGAKTEQPAPAGSAAPIATDRVDMKGLMQATVVIEAQQKQLAAATKPQAPECLTARSAFQGIAKGLNTSLVVPADMASFQGTFSQQMRMLASEPANTVPLNSYSAAAIRVEEACGVVDKRTGKPFKAAGLGN